MPCNAGWIQDKQIEFSDIVFNDRTLLGEALVAQGWVVASASTNTVAAARAGQRIVFTLRRDGSYAPTATESQKADLYSIRKEFNLRVVAKVTKALKGSSSPRVVTPQAILVRVRV